MTADPWEVSLPVDATDQEIADWVAAALTALDDRPRDKMWRYRAAGPMAEAIGVDDTRIARFPLVMPVGEARMLHDAVKRRGLTRYQYVRRAVGTILVVCDGFEVSDFPVMLNHGLLGPQD